MSRDKRYQRLLNSKRWMEVKRIVWLRSKGLCERCLEEGHIRAGVDCHHIVPVESAKTEHDMERLAYDPNNCRLLCVECHIKTHREMKSATRESHKQTEANRLERWIAKHCKPTAENEDIDK